MKAGAGAEIRGGYITLAVVGVTGPLYFPAGGVWGDQRLRKPAGCEVQPRFLEHPHRDPFRRRGVPAVPGLSPTVLQSTVTTGLPKEETFFLKRLPTLVPPYPNFPVLARPQPESRTP